MVYNEIGAAVDIASVPIEIYGTCKRLLILLLEKITQHVAI